MKKNISQNLFEMLKSKGLLAISSGLIVISCGTQMGGYSETDGVYYDPNKDTLPEKVMASEGGNHVGDYYDYQDSIRISEQQKRDYDRRYVGKNWRQEKAEKATSSDWGTYAGSETRYYGNDWGYPYGYGFYPRYYGWGGYYGMSFGWGNPWYGFGYDPFWDFGYSGYYSPYYFGYNPYYYGYSPYYGYYNPYYGYYNPYYGYYNPYYYGNYYRRAPRRASGADGYYGNSSVNGRAYQQNSGFRNGNNTYQNRNTAPTQSRMPATRRMPSADQPYYRTERQSTYEQPRYESPSRDWGGSRNDSGGFRSGGGDFGGSSSSRSGGGFRTGGGR